MIHSPSVNEEHLNVEAAEGGRRGRERCSWTVSKSYYIVALEGFLGTRLLLGRQTARLDPPWPDLRSRTSDRTTDEKKGSVARAG